LIEWYFVDSIKSRQYNLNCAGFFVSVVDLCRATVRQSADQRTLIINRIGGSGRVAVARTRVLVLAVLISGSGKARSRMSIEARIQASSGRRQATAALMIATAMQALDTTIANVALPQLEQSLG